MYLKKLPAHGFSCICLAPKPILSPNIQCSNGYVGVSEGPGYQYLDCGVESTQSPAHPEETQPEKRGTSKSRTMQQGIVSETSFLRR